MIEEQTDPVAQKRIIAQFQLEQEKKRIEEEKKKLQKRTDLWQSLPCPLLIILFLTVDSFMSRGHSRYETIIIIGVIWLCVIESRIISIQRSVEKLKAKQENKDDVKS